MSSSFKSLLLALGMLLSFSACKKQLHLVKSDPRYYVIDADDNTQNPEALSKLLLPYQEQYAMTMNDIIGQVAIDMDKAKPESLLGNWMTDLIHEKAVEYAGVPVDFTIQNYGGIRINDLPKGEVTRSKIYELMPFDNMLVIVACDGKTMRQLLDKMAGSGGWPISAGLRFQIADKKAIDVTIDGSAFDPSKTYHVAMPDYIAHGGDGSDFFEDQKKYDTGKFVRDLIIEGVEQHKGAMSSKLDGRITIKE